MISRIVFLLIIFQGSYSFSQISDSEMESLKVKWRIDLAKQANELVTKKTKQEQVSVFSDSVQRLFLKDTFIVENLLRKQLDKESSNLGINKANLACSSEYEKLVQKYYEILSAKMKDDDRELLVSWHQEWKKLMDTERVLIGKFMQETYTGGGSIHSIQYTNRLMMQQKNHLLTLIDYLTHMN
ncbi:hypothetical protein [Fluviicola taffensis]|uniref:Lysozyme inhibitor LprI N-terminal domain-containing protein n=1 Tax=Fluviicola taffensis (strain DSM 16823 / NCIMB 13979 / RW262) TaxID=755732 RepID=F2IIP9_FLUTR|nr:hypothetical protein [Fluviicola taffensis]AEA46011.1 hypothetical protein Fluta_4049 [Fluviicola taffensis DSM 16823]